MKKRREDDITLTSMLCPSCGGQVVFEKNQDAVFCSHCGSQIYKSDRNNRSYTRKTIDVAKIKEIESRERIELKKLEMEERSRKRKRRGIVAVVFLILIILGAILGFFVWFTNVYGTILNTFVEYIMKDPLLFIPICFFVFMCFFAIIFAIVTKEKIAVDDGEKNTTKNINIHKRYTDDAALEKERIKDRENEREHKRFILAIIVGVLFIIILLAMSFIVEGKENWDGKKAMETGTIQESQSSSDDVGKKSCREGTTNISNCQMLCKTNNLSNGNK